MRLLFALAVCLTSLTGCRSAELVSFTVRTQSGRATEPGKWEVRTLVEFAGFDEALMNEWRERNALYLQLSGEGRLYTATETGHDAASTTYQALLDTPGRYSLTVTELFLRRAQGDPLDHRVVKEQAVSVGGSAAEAARAEAAHRATLPHCLQPGTSLEQDWFAGHWDTRGADYAFVPDQCAFDQWSPADLRLVSAAAAGPRRWVLVLGSSKDRGVYSRLIDLVLRHEEKDKFHHSVVQKCWGWLDVRVGRLRLTFADFRAQFYFSAGVTCHNEKVASSPQLHLDGIKFWARLFREERFQPDIIWMVGDHVPQFPIAHYGLYLAQAVAAGWQGTFLFAPTDVMPNIHPAWLPCSHNVSGCGLKAREDIRALRAVHDNVVLVDMAPILFSSVTDMEKHLDANCYSCSNHYHYVCSGAQGTARAHALRLLTPSAEHDRRICGRVVNTAAQAVYNVLYGPREAALAAAIAAAGGSAAAAELVAAEAKDHALVCFDCPKDLVPIHITVTPVPACYWTPLKMQVGPVGASFPPPQCPCLNTSIAKTFTSHGGSVIDVRECDKARAAVKPVA